MELGPQFKATEVGLIPVDWDVENLGSICTIKTGEKDVNEGNPAGAYPFFTCSRTHTFSDSYSFDTEAILIAGNGDVGNLSYYNGKFEAYQRTYVVLDISVHVRYLWQQLNAHLVSSLDIGKIGSSIPYIKKENLTGFLFALPPTIQEQEAIAEALSDADALIESLEQLITKKRQIKQGAMQQLLTGKRRLPGFSSPWIPTKLGELAKITRGASPRPIKSPIWFDEQSRTGWVRIADVTSSGMFLYETTQRLSQLGIQNSRPVSSGSLIMSICATVGRPIVTRIDVCIHDGFVVFEALQTNQRFLYYLLTRLEPEWGKHGQTGSQMNLNTGIINATELSLPEESREQEAIAAVLFDMDKELEALEAKLEKARQIKQGMMHNLLTGRIRLV